MPLLRGIARTAAVAGTAKAVSNRVSRRQAGRWAAKDQQAAQSNAPQQQQYAQQPPPAPPSPPQDDMNAKLGQLKQLGELKDQGVISQAEFDQQKSRILG